MSRHADVCVASDQVLIDNYDKAKWRRTATLRPGDTILVQGLKPCGKLGPAVQTQVINACLSSSGGDQALAATREYGRKWFGANGSCYVILKVVAKRGEPTSK